MVMYGCRFTVAECPVVPEAFKTSVNRGNFFQAAAFSFIQGRGLAEVCVIGEFEVGTTLEKASTSFRQSTAQGGTIGSKFAPKKPAFESVFLVESGRVFAFTPAEILVDKKNLLQPSRLALVPAPGGVEVGSDYATLGLEPGASREQIRSAYRPLIVQHHPDRGGDPSKFMAVQSAYEALIGTSAPREGTIVLKPPAALTYEDSVEALHAEEAAAEENVRVLEGQLAIAKKHLAVVSATHGRKDEDIKTAARREKAKEFTKRFQCSAMYWELGDLECWFRPNCGFVPRDPTHWPQWVPMISEMYGEDLREGNEDLDPYCKIVAWHPRFGDNKTIPTIALHVKVGMDNIDAVDHGKDLVIAISPICHCARSRVAQTLKLMGWDYFEVCKLLSRDDEVFRRSKWYTDFDVSTLSTPVEATSTTAEKRKFCGDLRTESDTDNANQDLEEDVSDEEMTEILEGVKRRRQEQNGDIQYYSKKLFG